MNSCVFAGALLLLGACDVASGFPDTGDDKSDSSAEAVFIEIEFDGELVVDEVTDPEALVNAQLLYTMGHLNGDKSVGRLDQVALSQLSVESAPGQHTIRYHAVMPVAWGNKNVPASYTLTLPRDMSEAALERFMTQYTPQCLDEDAHDFDTGSVWFYYRPNRAGCAFQPGDVVKTTGSVRISPLSTTGKYPEYHKVWQDDVLRVIAVFGKNEPGASSNEDAGIAGYNAFSRKMRDVLFPFQLQTFPANMPANPGVFLPELGFRGSFPDGRRVEVVALLVDSVATAPDGFFQRYAELSGGADLIVYNGHAGLGKNIRALASVGDWQTGQYTIVFMNGCDTYAYIDTSLAEAKSAVNPDDPEGTKYLDIATNAMPAFFKDMPAATFALIDGLLRYRTPLTYEQMFANIEASAVVLISGEQDNVYTPDSGL